MSNYHHLPPPPKKKQQNELLLFMFFLLGRTCAMVCSTLNYTALSFWYSFLISLLSERP